MPVLEVLRGSRERGAEFRPAHVDIFPSGFPTPMRRESDPELELQRGAQLRVLPLDVAHHSRPVASVDSTMFVLGDIPDGVVCALRAAVVRHEPSKPAAIQRYGPYLAMVTNQTKDELYARLQEAVFGHCLGRAPHLAEIVNRFRSMLEQRIQMELAEALRTSILLFDGSLVSGFVGTPARFTDDLLDRARAGGNDVVAVSKQTTLALAHDRQSILSVLDGHEEPCFAEVKSHLAGDRNAYRGSIYVCRFVARGEPFRTDVRAVDEGQVLKEVAGLAGDFGYPEELRLAHVYAVFDAPEILELQAASVCLAGLELKDNLRNRLFGPWG